jgi:alpha-D-xyloside xylohydrolase
MISRSTIALWLCSLIVCSGESLIYRDNDAGLTTQIDAWGRDSVRVRIGPSIYDTLPGAIINPPAEEEGKTVSPTLFVAGNLQATVGTNGLLTFTRISDGKVLFTELERTFTPLNNGTVNPVYGLKVSYSSFPAERFYGLGEHKTGILDNKNQSFNFENCILYDKSSGSEICIPFLTSNVGYGFLWNLPSFGGVSLDADSTTWTSVYAYQLDIWVSTYTTNTTNPTGDILSNYVDATGHAPMLPYYASGFWQCKNRYRNQTELIAVAEGYLSRGLPLSIIVIDWYHWINLGDWSFNPACWPNPAGMTAALNAMGVQVMVSVWPLVSSASHNFQPMQTQGYLVKCPADQNECHPPDYVYDPTNPAARLFVWDQVDKGYLQNGIQTYWLDADEPETFSNYPAKTYSIGPQEYVGMMFPYFHVQTFYNGLRSNGIQETIVLSRSAWAGSQRWGAATWSGDIASTWESLNQQVRAGLNMGLSGIVWWTTDIGGYQNANITDPVWQELIVRWFQWGAFCPLFRLHGYRVPADPNSPCGFSGGPNEVWDFGDTAFEAISIVMKIREQLRPYIMQQMQVASLKGTPVMRPVWFDFPKDQNTFQIDDQFMFGPDYLVAPVLVYQARSRNVYLPAGANWVHWFTGQQYTGGQTLNNFAVPLNAMALFVRVLI